MHRAAGARRGGLAAALAVAAISGAIGLAGAWMVVVGALGTLMGLAQASVAGAVGGILLATLGATMTLAWAVQRAVRR